MAESYTNNGLDYLYRSAYCGSSQLATFYVGLFISQTQTTVPASTASGSSNGWSEVAAATGTYTRQPIAASAITTSGDVSGSARGSTWPQVTFTGFTNNPASPINGFGVFSGSVASTASPLWFANFDSGASRNMAASGDTLAVTPATRGTA